MTKAEGTPQTPKETATREQITALAERVKGTFPGSHAGIIIRYPDSPPIGVGHTEPMYMASMSKPFSVLAGLQMARQQDIDLRAKVFEFKGEEREELQTELREVKKDKTFVVTPMVSFQDLANYSLGVSSNQSLSILRRWMDDKLQEDEWEERNAIDYTQDLIEPILKKALGKKRIVWTFNNSTKENETGLWNCATLEEVEMIFHLIAEGDKRLGVSRDVIGIMREAMRESIDPDLELSQQIKEEEEATGTELVSEAFGKFGEYTLKGDEKIEPLFDAYTIEQDGNKLLCIGATERVTPIHDSNMNVAYFAAIPLSETATDEEVKEIKRRAAEIITSGLKTIIFAN
jgi:hypothetical protein